eukprot:Gb_03273 [translate_table: standard]
MDQHQLYHYDGNRSSDVFEANGIANAVDLALAEALEKSHGTVKVLDTRGLKQLVLSFEGRLRNNLEARMKYVDHDSEVELHEEINKLKSLAGALNLYPELVHLNTISSILGLLSHENTDIIVDVVNLLQDLTEEDVLEDSDKAVQILVDAPIEDNALELLVHNFNWLDENDPDEPTTLYNTLATIKNKIEIRPGVSECVCERTKLLRWLLDRIKPREFDSNKQYATEILPILLQNSSANQRRLGQLNGVDTVLQAAALYKSRDPKSGDEE